MITLGFSEFIRNIRKNIWIIVELIVLFVLGMFMVSTVSEQLRTYKPVKNVLDDSGIIINSPMNTLELKGVEEVLMVPCFGYASMQVTVDAIAYYDDYKMKLTSGKKCTGGEATDGVIRAVVCEASGLKPGDTYELNSKYMYMKFYVTGTFDEDEWVLGFNRGPNVPDYKVFYNTYRNLEEISTSQSYYLFVANEEDLQRELGVFYNFAIIDYKDDISEADIEFNKELLKENNYYEGRDYKSTRDVYICSKSLMEFKIIPIGIAFVIVFVFSIFSVIASSSVSFKYERRNYGIYFLTGNTWKNTIRIILVHWGIEIISALVISICLGILIGRFNIIPGLGLEFSFGQIAVISGIIIIQLGMALIIPWRLLRKTEPVTIIKESER